MSEENKMTNEDDNLRTGTSVEWRGGESSSGLDPEEKEEDTPRSAHHIETRSAGQNEGA